MPTAPMNRPISPHPIAWRTRRRCFAWALALTFVAAASHAAGHAPTATLANHLRDVCANLQQHGWSAPADPSGGRQAAVFDIPGVAYFCNLERPLTAAGQGHPPVLQALISDSGGAPSVILSADIWCAEDRRALAILADEIAAELARVGLQVPADILQATREGGHRVSLAQGLRFEAAPTDVDAQACGKVPAKGLGAVLMKIDVSIKPADGASN